MRIHPGFIALVIATALSTANCAKFVSAGPSMPGDPPRTSLNAGDRVRVTTHDGLSREFTVAETNTEGFIADDGTRLAYSDVSHIEKRATDGTKTTLLVVAIVGGTFVLMAAVAAALAPALILGG